MLANMRVWPGKRLLEAIFPLDIWGKKTKQKEYLVVWIPVKLAMTSANP